MIYPPVQGARFDKCSSVTETDSFRMGKKDNSKAKEKKAERRAMEARMNRGVANVKAANSVEDPLALLPKPFSVFNKNGLDLTLETVRAPELPEETKVAPF